MNRFDFNVASLLVCTIMPLRTLSFGEHVLTFVPIEKAPGGLMTLRDEQTGSLWSAFDGTAVEGSLRGKQLEPLPSTYAFWFAWKDYDAETRLYGQTNAIRPP